MSTFQTVGNVLKGMWATRSPEPQIRHLILHVTGRCELNCRHCFAHSRRRDGDLPIAVIRKVARVCPQLIWLDLSGGEPTLRTDLLEIAGLFEFAEFTLPSSGSDPERVFRVASELYARYPRQLLITLPLDGLQPEHDRIRGAGSFARVMETYRRLRGHHSLRVKFVTTLHAGNIESLASLMELGLELRPESHTVQLLRGSPPEPDLRPPSLAQWEAIAPTLSRWQDRYTYGRGTGFGFIQRLYQRAKHRLLTTLLRERRQCLPCLAGHSHLVVWANGEVSPCELLPSVGNLNTADLPDILTSQAAVSRRRAIVGKDCWCTHDCVLMDNLLFQPWGLRHCLPGRRPHPPCR